MKPIWPPFLVVTKIRLGLHMAAFLGIAGGENTHCFGLYSKLTIFSSNQYMKDFVFSPWVIEDLYTPVARVHKNRRLE